MHQMKTFRNNSFVLHFLTLKFTAPSVQAKIKIQWPDELQSLAKLQRNVKAKVTSLVDGYC